MTTIIPYQSKACSLRFLCVLLIAVTDVMLILSSDIADIYGQARQDDPHACLWFTEPTGLRIFRCCDGYSKANGTNLTDKCLECPSGRFGFFCNKKCTCENGGTCDKVDGSCYCSAEYFGRSCQYSCNCQNGGTCILDGSCSCVYGFYGDVCEKECLCPENSMCNSETGECICRKGFYGSLCLPCNCSEKEKCDPFDGECSCSPGYYGEGCEKRCSCFNGAQCGNDDVNSCQCPTGWTGSGCSDCNTGLNSLSFCYERCLHCYNGHVCSVENGDCECSPGWQGNRCDQICHEGFYGKNCSEECDCEHGICDYVTGICQCEGGWTGQFCNQTCPQNCVLCTGNVCLSCKAGWTGERCTIKCEPGFYGVGCDERCPQCNCTISCHHNDGHCPETVRRDKQKCKYKNGRMCAENPFMLECKVGWTGHLCTRKTSGDNVLYSNTTTKGSILDDSTANVNRIQAWIIVVVVVVTVIVLALVIILVARPCNIDRSKRRLVWRSHRSERETRTSTKNLDFVVDKNRPFISSQFVAIPQNITNETDDSVVCGATQRNEPELNQVSTTVTKTQKAGLQSGAAGTSNSDIEAVEVDVLIQTPEAESRRPDHVLSEFPTRRDPDAAF